MKYFFLIVGGIAAVLIAIYAIKRHRKNQGKNLAGGKMAMTPGFSVGVGEEE